jgi:hypothetical protein
VAASVHSADTAGWLAAKAIPDPKHIWHDCDRIVVYTGEDIPPVPPPEPRLITEDVAVAAIKRIAPATTDRQARDAIDAERVTIGVESEAREG